MLGLSNGDAKILRNAGARVTDDALRTLVLPLTCDDQGHRRSDPRDDRELSGLDTRSLEFRTVSDQQAKAVLEADVQKIRSSPISLPSRTQPAPQTALVQHSPNR